MSLADEISRDWSLAIGAAIRIADGEPLETIEDEPLEALSERIRIELIDREYRQEVDTKTQALF